MIQKMTHFDGGDPGRMIPSVSSAAIKFLDSRRDGGGIKVGSLEFTTEDLI